MYLFQMLLVIYMFIVLAMEVTWALGAWLVVYHGQRSWTALEPLESRQLDICRYYRIRAVRQG